MSTNHCYHLVFPDGTKLFMQAVTPIQIGEEISLPIKRAGGKPPTRPIAKHQMNKKFQVVRVCRAIDEEGDGTTYAWPNLSVYLKEI